METTELLKDLGDRLGVPFEPDADGTCAFTADGLAVSIHDLPELGAIALVGDLGAPPPERLEGLYKALLEANHLFRDTGGATISRNPDDGRLSLCRALPLGALSPDGFYDAVERFVSAAQVWAQVVRDYRAAGQKLSVIQQFRGDPVGKRAHNYQRVETVFDIS